MTQTDLMLRAMALTPVASVIAIGALGLRRLLRDHVGRYRLDCVALGCIVLTPVLLFASPHVWPGAAAPAMLAAGPERALIAPAITDAKTSGSRETRMTAAAGDVHSSAARISALGPGYMLVAAGLAGLVGVRLIMCARQLSRSRPLQCPRIRVAWRRVASGTRVGRRARLFESETLTTPVSWCLTYPAVHLPTATGGHPDELIDCILAHELIHLRRRDQLALLLQHLLLAATWVSPIMWWFHRVMCDDRELSCDEHVVRRTGAQQSYARALLLFGTRQDRALNHSLVALLGRGQKQLTRRIHMLAHIPASPSRLPIQLGLATVLGLLAMIGTGTVASALPPTGSGDDPDRARAEIRVTAPCIDVGIHGVPPYYSRGGSTNETVVSFVGTRSDATRLAAYEVTVNLPENSRLEGLLSGHSIRYSPGATATFEIVDGSISIGEPDGPRRIVVAPATDGATLCLASSIENHEYSFCVTARGLDGRPVAIEVETSLPAGDGQSKANPSLTWFIVAPEKDSGDRHRIRLTRRRGG